MQITVLLRGRAACLPPLSALLLPPSLQVVPPPRGEMKNNMESLIHHFKFFTQGECCRCCCSVVRALTFVVVARISTFLN